jgi:metal transporter CNNM
MILGNVAVNVFISIIMAKVATGLIAGIISTAMIVVFGEIIP